VPTLVLTWVTKDDDMVCPICVPLHGFSWRFNAGIDALPNTLNTKGHDFWDISLGRSVAHDNTYVKGKCRCKLRVEVDIQDIYDFAVSLKEAAK
jgi:hypothetical protein